MPKCDACAAEITESQMKVEQGEAVAAKTAAGFVPSKVGGGAGALGAQMGLSKSDMWKSSVARFATSEWGFCGSCHAEFAAFGSPRRSPAPKPAVAAEPSITATASAATKPSMEQPAAAGAEPGSFVGNLTGLWFSPRESFENILRRPGFWLALAVLVTLNVAFTAVWMQKVEPLEFFKAQLEESGRMDRIPADRRDDILSQQARMFPIFGWLGAVLGAPIFVLIVASVLLFVFRFFYASELSFKQSMAVVAHSFLAVGLITTPLMLATFALKGDWNINPQEVLQANVSLLLEKETTPKPVWALATSLDLFSFWSIALLATGYGVATRRSTGSAAWGIVTLWALVVIVKVGWAALM